MQERLVSRFMDYVKCDSESFNELAFCLLIEGELDRLGISHYRQESGTESGNGWVIFAKKEGTSKKEPVLISMHLDTVAPGNNIEPIVEDDMLRSKGDTVLGADGKAAIAITLEAIERILESGKPHRTFELLFTPCQEADAKGAKSLDYSQIESEVALIMDHTNMGELVSVSPAATRASYEIHGHTAHAAMSPGEGCNALQTAVHVVDSLDLGRVDDDSVVNVGDFVCLSRTNLVPAYARFDVEIRSFFDELLETHLENLNEAVKSACEKYKTTYNVHVNQIAPKIEFCQDGVVLDELVQCMHKEGIAATRSRTFGICEAMYLSAAGMACINLGIGMQNLHSENECIFIPHMKSISNVIVQFLTL